VAFSLIAFARDEVSVRTDWTTKPASRIAAPIASRMRRPRRYASAYTMKTEPPAGELSAAIASSGARSAQRLRFQPRMISGQSVDHQKLYSRTPNTSGLVGTSAAAVAIAARVRGPPQRESGTTIIRTVPTKTRSAKTYSRVGRWTIEIFAATAINAVGGRIR
jgi:hypothetical protein